MCGIGGIVTFGHADGPAVQAAGSRLVAALRHRGPDGDGMDIVQQPASTPPCSVLFGHTRLAIIDLSDAGRQPMRSRDGATWITFNGEIYNYRQVRQHLGEDGAWHSQTDTEALLRAYERHGRDCLAHLRGMFAFGLWDSRRQELFLARDRLGIKPLYYYAGVQHFVFASEVRALLATGLVPRHLDVRGVWDYLGYQTTATPRTMVEGVRSIPPGGWLAVSATGAVQGGSYWDPLDHANQEAKDASPEQARARVADLLREAVALHLVSDVPVGAFLSGGVDSTVLAALTREAGYPLNTFTVAFDERAYDEAPIAQLVARRFDTRHTEIILKEHDLLEQVPEGLAALDQPTADGLNTYIVARAVRAAGMKVALSGLGGDELFAGYPSFRRLARAATPLRLLARLPHQPRKVMARAAHLAGGRAISVAKIAEALEGDGTLTAAFLLTRQLYAADQRRALLRPTLHPDGAHRLDAYRQLLEPRLEGHVRPGVLTAVSYAEMRTYMHDLLLRDTDQMSMAHALEVRVPLLDHVLVEYVMGLPDYHKEPRGIPKRLLVQSLGSLLPREVAGRPKQGFTLPLADWMRGPLRGYCEARLHPRRVAARGVLEPPRVTELWRGFLAGRPDVSWSRIWALVALEEWLDATGLAASQSGA